jgi:hypothetical protein
MNCVRAKGRGQTIIGDAASVGERCPVGRTGPVAVGFSNGAPGPGLSRGSGPKVISGDVPEMTAAGVSLCPKCTLVVAL